MSSQTRPILLGLGEDGERRIVELCDFEVFATPGPREGQRAGRIGPYCQTDRSPIQPPISKEN